MLFLEYIASISNKWRNDNDFWLVNNGWTSIWLLGVTTDKNWIHHSKGMLRALDCYTSPLEYIDWKSSFWLQRSYSRRINFYRKPKPDFLLTFIWRLSSVSNRFRVDHHKNRRCLQSSALDVGGFREGTGYYESTVMRRGWRVSADRTRSKAEYLNRAPSLNKRRRQINPDGTI